MPKDYISERELENLMEDLVYKLKTEDVDQVSRLLSTIVTLAEEFIASMQEIENHTLTIQAVKDKFSGWILDVRRQFFHLANVDVPPDNPHDRKWTRFDRCQGTAGV